MDAPRTVPAAERQFSLVLALVGTVRGLTKTDILTSVHGYRQTYDESGITPALERKFERDKEELRDFGIHVETIDDPSAHGDNQLARYRIDDAAPGMPAGVHLDADEQALVTLAAAVWREGALAGESRRGVMKLRARGVELGRDVPAIAPRLRGREPQFEPLADAIESAVAVEFDYTKQGAREPERRRVEPLALLRFGGHWLLVAFDLGRQAERRFLLQRISGDIRRRRPIDADRAAARRRRRIADESLAELRRLAASQPVVVDVAIGSDAELRLARRKLRETAPPDAAMAFEMESALPTLTEPTTPRLTMTLETADLELLADELAGFGPEVVVVEPDSLRDGVAERLRRALADHDDATAAPRPSPADGG